jgi:predicted dehydrogenase
MSAPDPRTWQVKANGGGYAHGQITHSSGLLFWLTNLRAQEVTCRMTAPKSQVDLYDAATVVFENGSIGVVSGAATVPGGLDYQVDIRLFGTEGAFFIDVERERAELQRYDGNNHVLTIPAGEGEYSCDGPPNRFIEVIQGRGRNDSPGEVGARTVELIDAMFRSAESGGGPVKAYRPT